MKMGNHIAHFMAMWVQKRIDWKNAKKIKEATRPLWERIALEMPTKTQMHQTNTDGYIKKVPDIFYVA